MSWAILLASLSEPARADEFAVVVDTSASMQANDPGQVAILATLLLSDLLVEGEDELWVVPFDRAMSGAGHNGSGPVLRRSDYANNAAFVQALQGALVYDGRSTYFAPPLALALGNMGATGDRRVVLLLTDGGSNDEAGDEARFRDEILPMASKLGAQVWVVTLGQSGAASTKLVRYFRTHRQGDYAHASTAEALPGVFAEVLGRATGRRVETRRLKAGEAYRFDGLAPLARVDVAGIATGAVTTSHLRVLLNLHFHIVHLDGVFDRGGDDALHFFPRAPSTGDIEGLV
ncbi:MAG: hypothetical protein FJ102_21365, partial [Deltaproteobacteria bacterium]|nr:hypothetical protein [Deltaproteobacteria bacterium]